MNSSAELSVIPSDKEAHYQDRLTRVLDRYRVVLDNIQDVVGVHYLSGKVAWVSKSVYSVLGYTPEEVIGKNIHDFVNTEDYAEMAKTRHPLPKNGSDTRMRYRFKHKDGHWIWVETITTPVYNGKPDPIATQSHTRDISGLIAREQALERALSASQSIVRNALVPWATFNLEGGFTEVNDAWCNLLGYSHRELLELTFMDVTHPESAHKDKANMEDLLEGVVDVVELSKVFINKKGESVPVYIWGGVAKDHDGIPISMFAQAQSIQRIAELSGAIDEKINA